MSSDDSAIVHVHEAGGFTFTVFFAGVEERTDGQQFATLKDAWYAASDVETEYGVQISPDVWKAEEMRVRELVAQERRDHRKNLKLLNKQGERERNELEREIALRYMKEEADRVVKSKQRHPSNVKPIKGKDY